MKTKIILIVLCIQTVLNSCQKEYFNYSGPQGVYFGVRYGGELQDKDGPFQPESYVEFIKLGTDSYTCNLPIMLVGEVKDYDRKFKILIDQDSTTLEQGLHYKPIEDLYILKAGEHSSIVAIDFFAQTDLNDQQKRLTLKIIATEDLVPAFRNWEPPVDITGSNPAKKFDASKHTIYVNNMMVKPSQWLGSVLANGEEFNSLGAFSRKKMEFITEQLGITYSEFSNDKTMSFLRMGLIGSQMSRILIARFEAGNPVLEDDGRLMYFQGVPWKSYIGVAYKP
ncbi:DUF4843 domain-containing protein [Sphingobacterium composti Ten et al. 2007 non Yoo et al. 2007]|uniref:DUF4843 domain-containing protein n=1 Tax=Sphingobacterium composti TaxID=363260 RepID=UPI0021CDF048|nr:DUF4843 domain-containing protein [Sphingobacterium composti Ten et al. 2007 non Yoo et al. 2007]